MSDLNKKPYVIAARTDGFGERMCALLNAIAISQILHIEFKFSWLNHNIPDYEKDFLKNKGVENPYVDLNREVIFCNSFLEEYLLKDDILYSDTSNINTNELFNLKYTIPDNGKYWTTKQQYYVFKDVDYDKYRDKLQEAWFFIEFKDNLRKIINDANSIADSLGNYIAFHIRTGDIIYKDIAAVSLHANKTIEFSLLLDCIKKNKDISIFIFTDDNNIIEKMDQIIQLEELSNKIILVNDLGYKTNNDMEQRMLEIVLMSRANKIYSTNSGFSRLASMIGKIQSVNLNDLYLDNKIVVDIIRNRIFKNHCIVSKETESYSYFYLFQKLEDIYFKEKLQCITKAYSLYSNKQEYIAYFLEFMLLNDMLKETNNILISMCINYNIITRLDFSRKKFVYNRLIYILFSKLYSNNYAYINQFKQLVAIAIYSNKDKLNVFQSVDNYVNNMFLSINISINKPATQSSTSQWSKPNDAARALSGELTNNDFAFHTAEEENPWWIVDLEKEEYVYNIYIQNRIKMCKEKAKTLQVEISLDKENWVLIPNEYLKWTNLDYLNVELLNKYKARYIKLSLREKNYFHLAKVEVYALNDKVIEACRNLNDITKENMVIKHNKPSSANIKGSIDENFKANIIELVRKQNEVLEKLLKY